jgi:membrane protein
MERVRRGLRRLFTVMKESIRAWREDNGDLLAAALSYYAIFSLVPSLIIVIGLTGLVIDQRRIEAEIVVQIERWAGNDTAKYVSEMLAHRNEVIQGDNRFIAGLGLLVVLFGASGVFAHLQGALNTIWRIRPRPKQGMMAFIRTRIFAYIILLLIGFMLILSMVVNTWLVLIDDWFRQVMPNYHLLFNVGNLVLSYAITVLLFALLYKVMPDVTIRWHDIWVGAAVTALLFNLGKWVIALYLGSAALARIFGAAGALVALLIWVYYSALIILFGAEFIKVFALQRGRAVLPARHALNVRWMVEDHSTTD